MLSEPRVLITLYTPDCRREWDDFASRSRQASFLFQRAYMDYHADRFEDASLIARRPSGRIIAMLPASKRGAVVTSHAGLTYGGWITPTDHFGATDMMVVFESAVSHWRANGITELIYKPLPHIYPVAPADDDIYALFRLGAAMSGCSLSSAIDLRRPRRFNESTRQAVAAAERGGVTTTLFDSTPQSLAQFWQILSDRLLSRHGVRPVHSLEEISLLMERFPANISLHTAAVDGAMAAGAVVYSTPRVAHVQYMATTAAGRAAHALPLLVSRIAEHYAPAADYLDFGVSTTQGGLVLSEGLLLQKSGFGARAVTYPEYRLSLSDNLQ